MMFSMVSAPALKQGRRARGGDADLVYVERLSGRAFRRALEVLFGRSDHPHGATPHVGPRICARSQATGGQGDRSGRLVPIHSFGPDRFMELFESVTQEEDGVWWVV